MKSHLAQAVTAATVESGYNWLVNRMQETNTKRHTGDPRIFSPMGDKTSGEDENVAEIYILEILIA